MTIEQPADERPEDLRRTVEQHVGRVLEAYLAWQAFPDGIVTVNKLLLKAATDSAVVDLQRMVEFHIPTEKLPDRYKFAGFVSKWVAKFKPLQLSDLQGHFVKSDRLLWLNADFAVHVMASYMRVPVPVSYRKTLRYWLMYRDERGETLAFVSSLCAELAVR